ncbi:MAG: D-alanyl-D-alanine carboxypeptidase/D-alanyl-D-alanine-endopeptidase [Muribaculaceae bacterium]|nr:D-alanyl-D-alanine carboxypeptidase/D-alanyl-D-alanine-endopeptidase [Muribaculaceae bacterium]
MRTRIYILLLSLTLAFGAWPMTEQEAVDLFVGDPALSHAAAGVAVMRLDSGRVVASHLLDQAIITASTMKTVTSTAALETLGGDFQFETRVLLRGVVVGDTLCGDLVIVGGGDPTLGSRHFPKHPDIVTEVVQAVKQRGIAVVEGRVLTDENLYPYPPYSIHWDVGDLAWDYGAAVHALNYADNEAHVSFRVDKWGRFSSFTTKPHLSDVQVVNKMRFNASRENVDFALEYATPALVLMGQVCPGSYNLTFANPSPGQLLADTMLQALKRKGVKVLERTGLRHKGRVSDEVLFTHRSPVLTDIVCSLLDRSDNMFTHALLRAIAVRDKSWTGDDLDHTGVECVERLLKARGIDSEALFMRDGSGLARAGKASPHLFVQMLAYMAQRRYGSDEQRLCDLMPPVGSRIGSLLPGTRLSRNIVIKSGSMTDVQCFVGYYPASEPQYAFAVLVNNYNCPRKELKNLIDRLLINLFGQ